MQETMTQLPSMNFKMIYRLSLVLICLMSCSDKNEEEIQEDISQNPKPQFFKSIEGSLSGIDFSNDLYSKGDLNIIEYLYYYNGGGVAVIDINNDGLDDIYFSANQKPDQFYLNLGNMKFKDISKESGISQDSTWSTGVTSVDINKDGFLDIYVCKVGNYKSLRAKNELYVNQGDNTFKESASEYGLDFSGFSTQAAFFDYDNDGDDDMYLLNHSIHSTNSYGNIKTRSNSDSLSGDVFFKNLSEQGEKRFKEVTSEVGIYNSALGYGLALAVSDVNSDGYLDIYVGNDFHENDYLYINDGKGDFSEQSENFFNHTTRFTMGVDFGDVNNDGLLDAFTLDMMPNRSDVFLKSGGEDTDKVNSIKKAFGFQQQYARNHLQLNGNSSFRDVALASEVHATDWSWSPLIFDVDNDGLNDLYITNGIYKRPNDLDYIKYLSTVDFAKYKSSTQDSIESLLIETMPALKIQNTLFKNNGQLNFEMMVMDDIEGSFSNGAAYSDLDNDGDLDVIVNNINQPALLLENQSVNSNYLKIHLENNQGRTVGSKVYVYSDSLEQIKEQTVVKGFQSSSTREMVFGLGDHTEVDSVVVIWNDFKKATIVNPDLNTILSVSNENALPYKYPEIKQTLLTNFGFTHVEDDYLDYEFDALVPERLSTEGPSAITADFNGDDILDVFIGGARGQSPELFLSNSRGNLENKTPAIFKEDEKFEDVDAATIDIDSDGDLDIYALSGGNDYQDGHPLLQDRIYINDGKGNFRKLRSELLKTNGGSVSVGDFNGDKLDDLFIGNRSIANSYGLSPNSIILKNVGNSQFEIETSLRLGMVTDSEWVDLDGNGFMDLVVVGDWMPITLLSYDGSKFDVTTEKFGLNQTNGMWNCLTITDINQDGKLDILAGNAGLNLKWKASVENPVTMYLNDFDKNSKLDQIIFYDFFGTNVPFASRDQLTTQLPFLKKKFNNYKTFSTVNDINDLIDKDQMNNVQTKNVYELRSMLFIQTEDGFEAKPLPIEAQLSSIEDFLVDGSYTFYTGNFDGYVTELGQSSANSGGVMIYEQENFKQLSSLHLPKDFFGRHFLKISDNNYVVIANNGPSKLIKKEELKL